MEITNHKLNARTSVQLVAQGTELSLRSFLELSWFFPENFQRESLLETEDNYFVFGADRVLRFKRPSLGSLRHLDGFADRWRAACQRVLDDRPLGEELYLGLQLFDWEDGELIWRDFVLPVNLDPEACPDSISESGEVAIVMRRMPESLLLSPRLAEGTVTERDLRRLVCRLGEFHQRQVRENLPVLSPALELRVEQSYEQLPELAQQLLTEAQALDLPVIVTLAAELRSYLIRILSRERQLLASRWERGFVIDAHGDLALEHLALGQPIGKSLRPLLYGRALRGSESRLRDVLAELAELYLELEVRNFAVEAKLVEKIYVESFPEHYQPEVFRLSLVEIALKRAVDLLRKIPHRGQSEGPGSILTSTSLEQVERNLASAYRQIAGHNQPTIVVFAGQNAPLKGNTAWAFSRLVGADFIGFAGEGSSLPACESGLDFEAVLGISRDRIRERRGVVIECAGLLRADRLRLLELSRRFETRVFFVNCELGRAEKVLVQAARKDELLPELSLIAERSLVWDEELTGLPSVQLNCEPCFAPLELARSLVHQLRLL